jgi:putative ABC transport system permease protein
MEAGARISPGLRWMILGEWRAHPARAATAAIAIALGVALGYAVHLINASAFTAFTQAVRTVSGEADLQVRARTAAGFDERVFPVIARTPGVAEAGPGVELAAVADNGARMTLLGLDALRAAAAPALFAPPGEGGSAFDDGAAHLSSAALAASGRKVGDFITLSANGRAVPLRIAGVLPADAGGRSLAVMDIAAAQWRFGVLGRLDRVDVKLERGADERTVRARIEASLPADAEVVSQADEARRSDSLSRAYRVNLQMLGLVALLTGAFLVYSAQSLSTARRRPQFALLRVLGARQRAIVGQVLAEGAAVGVVGAVAGLALGLGAAEAALRFLGGDLGGGYFGDQRPPLAASAGSALVFGGLGLAAALLGSFLPARAAARLQPAAELKGLGGEGGGGPARLWPSLLLLAAGAASAFAPAIGGVPVFGYIAIALLLAGGVAAMPWIARRLFTPLQRRPTGRPPFDLAVRRIWGAPSQAGVALCGLVASTSLMIAMAVMVSSFRGSVEEWLDQILPADLYLRLDGGVALDPAAQAKLAAQPGVRMIRFRRTVSVSLAADRPPLALIAADIPKSAPQSAFPVVGATRTPPRGVVAAWISEPASRTLRLRAGQRLRLPIGPGGSTEVFVAGVWRDYSRQHGAVALDSPDYERLTGDRGRTEAAIDLSPGADPAAAAESLRRALPPAAASVATIGSASEIRSVALRVFDRSFAVTYGLEAAAIAVGLAGAAAAFAAQTLARTREFGMLRHIGVRRKEIAAMLGAEGAMLGVLGAASGLGLGVVMSQVLIHVVNPQSFHWTMQTKIPWGLFGGVAAALVVATAGASLLAGRRALSREAVLAVREDW